MGTVLRHVQRADDEKIKLNETHHGSFRKATTLRPKLWIRAELIHCSGAKE